MEPKRWVAHFPEPQYKESPSGGWVQYDDYRKLQAKVEKLEKQLAAVTEAAHAVVKEHRYGEDTTWESLDPLIDILADAIMQRGTSAS